MLMISVQHVVNESAQKFRQVVVRISSEGVEVIDDEAAVRSRREAHG
jgi:hypothetical protein